jgi:DNA transposition AAA+ family ATPase
MRSKFAMVKNAIRLQAAYEQLAGRDPGTPGMGLVHGFTGYGKTTAVAWLVNQTHGIYVRSFATWTPSAMLGSLMVELGAEPLPSCARMAGHIVNELCRTGRPVFVDEADYLLANTKMIESLRDIHDASNVPVILIGMEGIERRLIHRQQLARRISHWVAFQPCDAEDARTLADTVCEVAIEDDLLLPLHGAAKGSIGLMVVGLARIEAVARGNRLKTMGAEQWGDRQFFLSRPQAQSQHGAA